jgi:hypothetical protein
VILEAWDAGAVPIAWMGSGGPAEIIEVSGGGLLYGEQTGESLGLQIRRVIEFEPEQRQALVERGRAWLSQNCDPVRYATRMLSYWDAIAGDESP